MTEFAERYLEVRARPKKKPSSVKTDEELLRNCILPALGSRTLHRVSRADVRRMHFTLRKTPGSLVTGDAAIGRSAGCLRRR